MEFSLQADFYLYSTNELDLSENLSVSIDSDPSRGLHENLSKIFLSGTAIFEELYFINTGNYKIVAKDLKGCRSYSKEFLVKGTTLKITFTSDLV